MRITYIREQNGIIEYPKLTWTLPEAALAATQRHGSVTIIAAASSDAWRYIVDLGLAVAYDRIRPPTTPEGKRWARQRAVLWRLSNEHVCCGHAHPPREVIVMLLMVLFGWLLVPYARAVQAWRKWRAR